MRFKTLRHHKTQQMHPWVKIFLTVLCLPLDPNIQITSVTILYICFPTQPTSRGSLLSRVSRSDNRSTNAFGLECEDDAMRISEVLDYTRRC